MPNETVGFGNLRDNVLYSNVFQTLHDNLLEEHKNNLVGHDQKFLKSKI